MVIEELANTQNKKARDAFLEFAFKIKRMELTEEAIKLAQEYIKEGLVPEVKRPDALHMAIAVVENIDILVSWNYNHIVNRNIGHKVNAVNVLMGYRSIEIYFPSSLLSGVEK